MSKVQIKSKLTLCLLTLLLLCVAPPLQASEHGAATTPPPAEHGAEAAKAHPAAGSEHGGGAKQSVGGEGHGAAAPGVYYLNWGLLAVTFLIVCFYCLWVRKRGKPKHEGLGLPFLLVLVVILMYTLDQFPEVLRHFDAASRQFVDGYHEPPGMGSIKFIYKMGLGVCLTIYGIIGREEH